MGSSLVCLKRRPTKFHPLLSFIFSSLKQILKGLLKIPFRLEKSWATCSSGLIKSSADLTLHWFSWKFHTKNSGPCGRSWSPASNVLSHPPREGEWNTSQRVRPDSQKATAAFFIFSSHCCCWDPWGNFHFSTTSHQCWDLKANTVPVVRVSFEAVFRRSVGRCLSVKWWSSAFSTFTQEVIENGWIKIQYDNQNRLIPEQFPVDPPKSDDWWLSERPACCDPSNFQAFFWNAKTSS